MLKTLDVRRELIDALDGLLKLGLELRAVALGPLERFLCCTQRRLGLALSLACGGHLFLELRHLLRTRDGFFLRFGFLARRRVVALLLEGHDFGWPSRPAGRAREQTSQDLETARLERARQPSRRLGAGQRIERLGHGDECGRRRSLAGLLETRARRIHCRIAGRAMRSFNSRNICVLTRNALRMCCPEPLGGRDQPVVSLSIVPVELIDGPRGRVRLLEFLDLARARAGGLRQRVAGVSEFGERQLVQAIDFSVDGGHALIIVGTTGTTGTIGYAIKSGPPVPVVPVVPVVPGFMCRNIRTLFNFDPPATEDEVRAASLQFVRKLSGFTKPSKINAEAFDRAVEETAAVARKLIDSLTTTAPSRDRAEWAARAKARAAERYGTKSA